MELDADNCVKHVDPASRVIMKMTMWALLTENIHVGVEI